MLSRDRNTLALACYCLGCGVLVGALWTTVAIVDWSKADWGKASDATTAIATSVLATATLGLLLMAWHQLSKQTYTQRQWATLQACDRYDSDPILSEAKAALMGLIAEGKTTKKEFELRQCCRLLFNYFDSIAIGLDQGLYVEEIVVEHLGPIMLTWRSAISDIQNYTVERFVATLPRDYQKFETLASRWGESMPHLMGISDARRSESRDERVG